MRRADQLVCKLVQQREVDTRALRAVPEKLSSSSTLKLLAARRDTRMAGPFVLWSEKRDGGLPPSGYELSLGKITDVLRSDHENFFRRPPDFSIYAEDIAFDIMGRDARVVGKRKYEKIFSLWRNVTCTVVSDGEVQFRIVKAEQEDYELKVRWCLRGKMVLMNIESPIFVDAVSLYSLGAAPSFQDMSPSLQLCDTPAPALTHKVRRHTVEFVEVHPPLLRNFLFTTPVAAMAV